MCGVGLGIWVDKQRQSKKKGKLPPEREAKLQQLVDEGTFRWSVQETLDSNWEETFKQLQDYCEEHGHCNVPFRMPGSKNKNQ